MEGPCDVSGAGSLKNVDMNPRKKGLHSMRSLGGREDPCEECLYTMLS